MAEKVVLTISPAVAAYVRPGTDLPTRLAGCTAAGNLPATDRILLLFCLSKDSEHEVRTAALSSLKELPREIIEEYRESTESIPRVIAALPTLCSNYPYEQIPAERPVLLEVTSPPNFTPDATVLDTEVEEDQVNEESDQFLSKYKMAQLMGIGEKIKMALSGDKEWRAILVKDANKLVSGSVIKNPRITDGEILTIIKAGIANDEIMRLICANKEWVKIYKIRRALVENNRTPVQNAIRYLGTLGEKDLAQLAKSKNIASVIATMAKRLLLNKKR